MPRCMQICKQTFSIRPLPAHQSTHWKLAAAILATELQNLGHLLQALAIAWPGKNVHRQPVDARPAREITIQDIGMCDVGGPLVSAVRWPLCCSLVFSLAPSWLSKTALFFVCAKITQAIHCSPIAILDQCYAPSRQAMGKAYRPSCLSGSLSSNGLKQHNTHLRTSCSTSLHSSHVQFGKLVFGKHGNTPSLWH